MDKLVEFREDFKLLTGNPLGPFPWQESLYQDWFSQGDIPARCSLPTGLGKTSVIAVWLIALGRGAKLPRRLVYVVNRRTVVDQTTTEVERLRENLPRLNLPGLEDLLAISTLRGQFADNREWSADPSRPALISGTVDMIGSRLLFSGYGVGFKARPLHAGFLGQDVLIIHDEAHLEPAFQRLLEAIRKEQARCQDFAPIEVMELTATSRSINSDCSFGLTHDELNPPQGASEPTQDVLPIQTVWRRLRASKQLTLTQVETEKAVIDSICRIAEHYKDQQVAVLVYVRTLEAVAYVKNKLEKTKRPVLLLTGTMRGKERDELITKPQFLRFLKHSPNSAETVYLVCTSAGEVGVDMSADHMVCDLSTFESMIQRFGRVNRYGLRTDAQIDVVYPSNLDESDLKAARVATLSLLQALNGDASPKALGALRSSGDLADKMEIAFAPPPVIPSTNSALFDAWALTSIREPMPGRPAVEPFLHGIEKWQPPESLVAWREEVEMLNGDLLTGPNSPEELLDDYPLLPHELLRDRSDRVFRHIALIAERRPDAHAWVIDPRGSVHRATLQSLADKEQKSQIENKTILLPPGVGGLTKDGMLDGKDSAPASDVADAARDERRRPRRQRIWDDSAVPSGLRIIRTIDTRPNADDSTSEDSVTAKRLWHWCDQPREGGRTLNRSVTLDEHVGHVVDHAKRIVAGLSLPGEIGEAVIVAAELHDCGKQRDLFQLALGNRDFPRIVLAKSNGKAESRLPEPFRHEFASLLDARADSRLVTLRPEIQDLVLHLIAAHHGRARPHFDPEEAFDPQSVRASIETLTLETPRRFARLQRMYGRWGLAYLESLLRAADWAASAQEAEASR